MGSRRGVLRVTAVLALAALTIACTPQQHRGHAVISSATADGETVELVLVSCNGGPAVEVVEETEERVTVSVIITYREADEPSCQDTVAIELSSPLEDRELAEVQTGLVEDVNRATSST